MCVNVSVSSVRRRELQFAVAVNTQRERSFCRRQDVCIAAEVILFRSFAFFFIYFLGLLLNCVCMRVCSRAIFPPSRENFFI